jgi:AcrR family transcriptional regulator
MINADFPRPRGRPRAFDRDAALGLARRTFWRLGYEGASIADLTAAMGITPQSLYAAFSSKANLYREALSQYRRTDGAYVWRAIAEEPTAAAAFRRVLTEAAHQYARRDLPPGCMMSTGITSCAEENRAVADHVTGMRQEALARFRARIEKGVADGDVAPGIDALASARFLQTVIQGMSIQARDGAGEADLSAVADMACDQLDRQLSAGSDASR